MKKLKYGMVFLAVVGIGIVSCEKEKIAETENKTVIQPERTLESILDESTIIDQHLYPGLSVENGVLSFESIAYYEKLVVGDEQGNGVADLTAYLRDSEFNSYGKINKESSIYQDEFMDAIMNEDKVVKIGEWFIYIDTESEVVKAISDEEANTYESLLTNSNRTIKTFSTGDDVLDHLANNTSPDDRSCGGIGGNDQVSSKIYIVGSTWYESEFHFNRFGVYFVLKGGFDSNDIAGFGTGIELQFLAPELWCQRRPCGSGTEKTRNTVPIPYSGVYKADFKFYENVRNLNGYYFYSRVKVSYCGSNYYSNYTGGCVNC